MPSHIAQLYRDPPVLAAAIARFTSQGLASGDAVILLLTEGHWAATRRHLHADNQDVEANIAEGRLTVVEATAALAGMVVDGVLQPDRFHAKVVPLIDAASRFGPRTRVFGELVNLLVVEGLFTEAARLEDLWNALSRERTFSLLCAYRMSPFEPTTSSRVMHQICGAHDHVDPGVDEQRFVDALEQAIDAELSPWAAVSLRSEATARPGPRWEQLLNELHASFPLTAGRVLRGAQERYEAASRPA